MHVMMLRSSPYQHGMVYMHILLLLFTCIIQVNIVLGFGSCCITNQLSSGRGSSSKSFPLCAAFNGDNSKTTPSSQSSSSSSSANTIPRHIAFICDGNSRWATARRVPTAVGHAAGADRLVQILEVLQQHHHQQQQQQESSNILYCTMYGFSTENWKRTPQEIHDIFTVMERTARQFHQVALERNVRVKMIGDLEDERIPTSLRDTLQLLEQDTTNNVAQKQQQQQQQHQAFTLCLAINYGGRQDILQASKRLAQEIANGSLDADSITENTLSSFLTTATIPDPDLIIRTSGECRLSNFFLWNAAYAELYFTDTLWPDFDVTCLNTALEWYAKRKRRFGARHHYNNNKNHIHEDTVILPTVDSLR